LEPPGELCQPFPKKRVRNFINDRRRVGPSDDGNRFVIRMDFDNLNQHTAAMIEVRVEGQSFDRLGVDAKLVGANDDSRQRVATDSIRRGIELRIEDYCARDQALA
jgi:hypothetical protein